MVVVTEESSPFNYRISNAAKRPGMANFEKILSGDDPERPADSSRPRYLFDTDSAGQQLLDQRYCFAFQLGVIFPCRRPRIACVDRLHQAIPADEEGSGPAVQILYARKRLGELIGSSGHQHGIGNPKLLNHGLQPCRIRALRFFFKAELHDFQAAAVVLAVQLFEKGSFVLAVRAPATADGDDERL